MKAAVSTCSLVVENIFKYLEVEDLKNCAKVCSLWKKEAEDELKRRDIIYLLLRRIPFGKMVREITAEVTKAPHDWHRAALDILHEIAEDFLNNMFDDALISANFDGRGTRVNVRDLHLSQHIRGWGKC